ncbi:hypothetical protein PORCAN_1606 [Porphyromonas crevioricanis JCM 13913]|nr:hypothetical protein PORCAN_1606 [Porphyromonas crevioricanis JCM 13913]
MAGIADKMISKPTNVNSRDGCLGISILSLIISIVSSFEIMFFIP